MADDVEALVRALELRDPVVMGWSFGSFVAQAHMIRHGTAAAYVLMGTVAEPGALQLVASQLERFEPEHLRQQVRTRGPARCPSRRRRRRDSCSPTSIRSIAPIPKARSSSV